MQCIAKQGFDSEIFGLDYFRITDFGHPNLVEELGVLRQKAPLICDAKISAGDLAMHSVLTQAGFVKACVQFKLRHDLSDSGKSSPNVLDKPASDVEIVDTLSWSTELIAEHARHFSCDRISLDTRIPREFHDAFYQKWISNSISGAAKVAVSGRNFCSFKKRQDVLVIDLLSCLDEGRGIGKSLVNAVVAECSRLGLRAVEVTTECENTPAWHLYMKCGFQTDSFLACYHLVEPADALSVFGLDRVQMA